MYRHDYILRVIEQMSRALRTLLSRILSRETSAGAIRTDIAAIALEAGLDLDVARRLDASMLLTWLAPLDEIDPGRLWLLGELLYLDGLLANREGETERARTDLERAQTLLSRLEPQWRPQADLSSAAERLAEIRTLLNNAQA